MEFLVLSNYKKKTTRVFPELQEKYCFPIDTGVVHGIRNPYNGNEKF